MIGAQIAPKNIINQPGNREVEDRPERKIGIGINFIATYKMIKSPSAVISHMISASKSISVFSEGKVRPTICFDGLTVDGFCLIVLDRFVLDTLITTLITLFWKTIKNDKF